MSIHCTGIRYSFACTDCSHGEESYDKAKDCPLCGKAMQCRSVTHEFDLKKKQTAVSEIPHDSRS